MKRIAYMLVIFLMIGCGGGGSGQNAPTLPLPSLGTMYYVDYIGGADTNNGTSTSTAWKHLPGHIDNNATDNSLAYVPSAGDIIVLKGGVVYTALNGLAVTTGDVAWDSGDSINPITITSLPSWGDGTRAIIDGGGGKFTLFRLSSSINWIVVSNIEFRNVAGYTAHNDNSKDTLWDNCVFHPDNVSSGSFGFTSGGNSERVTISNSTAYGGQHGFIIGGTITLKNSVAYSNLVDGIRVAYDNNVATITNCTAYSNGDDGYDFFGSNNKIITKSIAYSNVGMGFKMGAGATNRGMVFNYCIAYNNGQAGFGANAGDGYILYNNVAVNSVIGFELWGADNTIVINNIGYNNSNVNIQIDGTHIPTMNHNIWYSATGNTAQGLNRFYNNTELAAWKTATGQDANSFFSDPLFQSIADNNFRLKSGSNAINGGTDVGLLTDFAGTNVPLGSAPEIGAYEFQP